MNLQTYGKKFIKNYSSNIFYIQDFSKQEEMIKKWLIQYKAIKAKENIVFSINDLALVRITDENNYPRNLTYFPLNEKNCGYYIENPFRLLLYGIKYDLEDGYNRVNLGCASEEIDYKNNYLLSYRHRRTKHFSINGLASNVKLPFGPEIKFNEGSLIIIEPLKDKIENHRLIHLNPVDTFFDLNHSSMPIGENAVFLIQRDKVQYYFSDPTFSEKIRNKRIFIFENNPSLATDLVLMYLGIVPQHSLDQRYLEEEFYFENKQKISDIGYLVQFKDFIKKLNEIYLNSFEEEVLHSKNIFAKKDIELSLNEDIKTYEAYFYYLFGLSSLFDEKQVKEIIQSVKKEVLETGFMFSRNFSETCRKYREQFIQILVEMQYFQFVNYTEQFNQIRLKNLKRDLQG